MDSPIVARLFKQLFRHRACPSRRNFVQLATAIQHARRSRERAFATARRGRVVDNGEWQQRTQLFPTDRTEEYKKYPMVTAKDLRSRVERPRRVKMLMREFIEDSLYNPNYGYFSKQAVIFSSAEPFSFPKLRDDTEFQNELSRRYVEFEDALDRKSPSDTRQLWYTPTELFRPHYGEAIARYLVDNYKWTGTIYPNDDLLIYEMGAGRGTLMLNILDYIRDTDEDVYNRTQYKIIEISAQLASMQTRQLLSDAASRGHASRVEIINRSIFDWDRPVPSPCFFLAFEVFDNFAHDVLRYDIAPSPSPDGEQQQQQPLQGVVLIDELGDFYEFYERALDPVAARFLGVRDAATGGRHPLPYPSSRLGRWLRARQPFAPNLSAAEYIPTRLMQFFDVLERYFPRHRLLTSDFHALPDAIKGLNAPVVQTRYQRRPVPVSTPLVHQGYFDIMFPTDFRVTEAMYRAITGKLTQVSSHGDFMRRWVLNLEDTATLSGENPLLEWYKNASVLLTT